MSAKVSPKKAPNVSPESTRDRIFSFLFGCFIGLSLLKFGDACLFENLVEWPRDIFEWAINHWPISIAYWLLGGIAILGAIIARKPTNVPKWILIAPLVWFGWQLVSATHTVDAELTRVTLLHFTGCVICFYLGVFCLSRNEYQPFFWIPVLIGICIVIANGFQQHFGGLEETRRYFLTYVYPEMKSVPPEYLAKISSSRIFSTLFYPNALAGIIILLLPPTLVAVWKSSLRCTFPTRCVLTAAFGLAALCCLFWSGSKGGWLLALSSGLVALFRLEFSKRIKVIMLATLLIVGMAGFFWKYSGYFQRGAKSVGARFDYWNAAAQTAKSKPVFGSGPGTFGISYKAIKNPESEMARLAHNDYVQQASDSGVVGFVAFMTWMVGIIWLGYPKSGQPWSVFAVWIGLVAWALQGTMEFGLYIPALAWTGFALSGWILSISCAARSNRNSN